MKNTLEECMTIVIPVYNRPVLVERCLDSIFAQTYRPLHLIVVDNASTDSTPDVLENWRKRKEGVGFKMDILTEKCRGAAYARQKGLEHCTTDKVMFLDSDDSMRPECVATVMDTWRKDPAAEIVAWPIARYTDGRESLTHSIKGNLLERHLVHAIFLTVGYSSKTGYLKSVGGWRGNFPVWDDLELGTRVLLPSPRVTAIKKPLVDVYPQEESITGVNFSNKAGAWEKSLDGMEASIRESGRSDIGHLLNIVSYRRAILAADYAKERRPDLAKPLYRQAISEVSRSRRLLIWFAYQWTRLHLRGAFHIVGKIL